MSNTIDLSAAPVVDIAVALPARPSVSFSQPGTIGVTIPGIPGPPGSPGTLVVAVPYDQWPPANPQPDVLYLRIAQ